ncbi:universal stress protein [Thermodesulfovibrionales bacterium]|nr:universal stress protein [Thermodesulfovibrionales bacterium]
MNLYKKILTPLDGSEFAECSLEHAQEIAVGCHASEVVLFLVLDPIRQTPELSVEGRRKAEQKVEAEAANYLNKAAGKLKEAGVTTRIEITRGIAAAEIIDYVSDQGIDLVIMSTRGRTGISRWALGSVAEKVLRRSVAPVLIISPVTLNVKAHEKIVGR